MEMISLEIPSLHRSHGTDILFCKYGHIMFACPNNVSLSTADKDDGPALCHCGPCPALQEHDSLTERKFKTIVNMKLSPVTMHFDLFH